MVSVRLISGGEELGSAAGSASGGNFIVDVDIPGESPGADEVEITVMQDECEQSFLFDVENDIILDVRLRVVVYEIDEPVLVLPCE
jgi:hypothetical protein